MDRPYLNFQQRQVKSKFIAFVQRMPKETTYAVTLQTHSKNNNWLLKSTDEKRQYFDKEFLYQWDKIVCRKLIGPRYHKENKRAQRQSGFAFPEKFDESPHYHLIIDIKKWKPEEYIEVATRTWLELVRPEKVNDPRQTFVEIIPIYGSDWEVYSTKDWDMEEPDSWIPIPYV